MVVSVRGKDLRVTLRLPMPDHLACETPNVFTSAVLAPVMSDDLDLTLGARVPSSAGAMLLTPAIAPAMAIKNLGHGVRFDCSIAPFLT